MNFAHGVFHFALTLLVYLGLPLVGWDLDDLAGFFSGPARLGFALVYRAWVGIAAGLVLLVSLLLRISDEENMLHRGFGEE